MRPFACGSPTAEGEQEASEEAANAIGSVVARINQNRLNAAFRLQDLSEKSRESAA